MKKLRNLFIGLLILILPVLVIQTITPVKADSGWDTSYDSGGSWSGGDSWDSGSSWDSDSWSSGGGHYSSSSDVSPLGLLIAFIIFAVIFAIVMKTSKNNSNHFSFTSRYNYKDLDEETLKKLLPNLTLGYLKQSTYNKFVEIQTAWMNFDYDKLRELCTDELYNSYVAQLDTLKLKNGQNIMTDFDLHAIKVFNVTQEGENIVAQVYMNVSFYDYVINKADNSVTRGNKNNKVNNNYVMTFIRSKDDISKDISCPNCGAPIENNASNKCEYCDSTIVKASSDFVLSKKTNINGR